MASILLVCCIATAAKCTDCSTPANIPPLNVTELFQSACIADVIFYLSLGNLLDVLEEQEDITILCGVCNCWSVVWSELAPPAGPKSVRPYPKTARIPVNVSKWNTLKGGIDAMTKLIESCRERIGIRGYSCWCFRAESSRVSYRS